MNIVEVCRRLLINWRKILIFEAIFIVIGITVSLSIPKEYTVSTVLVKEKNNNFISNNITFESLNMIDLSNFDMVAPKDAYSLFVYPVIFDSPSFRQLLLNIQVTQDNGKKSTFRDYLEKELSYPWWTNVINKIDFSFLSKQQFNSLKDISIEDRKLIDKMMDRVALIVDRKTLTLTVNVTMQDPLVAYVVADSTSHYIQNFISEYRIAKAEQEFIDSELIYLDTQENYYENQKNYLNFLDSNNNISSYKKRFSRDILKTERDLSLQLYNQAAKQVQIAKAKAGEQSPVLFVMVPPIVPIKPSYPSLILITLGFIIWGSIFSVWYTFK